MEPTLKDVVLQIAASPRFQSAPRLSALLQYLAKVQDSGTLPKEYSIGVDVLGRPADFDPRTDSIVRVHMLRLRNRLIEYHQEEGRDAAIQLAVPRGEYRLEMVPRDEAAAQASSATSVPDQPEPPIETLEIAPEAIDRIEAAGPNPATFRPRSHKWWVAAGIALVAALTVGGAVYWTSRPIEAEAKYVGSDIVTRGSWVGVYGQDGQIIPNQVNDSPSYAKVSVSGATTFTWWVRTKDRRALQKSPASSERVASLFYPVATQPNTFSITVTLTDGKMHNVALYLCDWDGGYREQSILLSDPATGRLLDSRTYHKFQKGLWAVWKIKGSVRFQILGAQGGGSAAVSGILFGGEGVHRANAGLGNSTEAANPTEQPGKAAFLGTDQTTQGDWMGRYGKEGQLIANDVNDPPPYAIVTIPGALPGLWGKVVADRRALQQAKANRSRIASYYQPVSPSKPLSIEVELTGSEARQIAIYLCDWNRAKRIQTISIFDAVTNHRLDSQRFTASAEGVWALWKVSGNVLIEVRSERGTPPNVSGLFFE